MGLECTILLESINALSIAPWTLTKWPRVKSSSVMKLIRAIDHDTNPNSERITSKLELAYVNCRWSWEENFTGLLDVAVRSRNVGLFERIS